MLHIESSGMSCDINSSYNYLSAALHLSGDPDGLSDVELGAVLR